MKKTAEFYAIVPPGFEEVCQREMQAIGLTVTGRESGGLSFAGGLRELYLANLHLRSASKILVRVGRFRATDFPGLYRRVLQLPWGSFIVPGRPFRIKGVSHQSRLLHTGRIAETIHAAVTRALGSPEQHDAGSFQTLLFRFTDDECVISVDASGELLHRRGYRAAPGAAPIRENLAAAVLLCCSYDGSIPFCDPLCGSGTIAVEAALIASCQSPGERRDFAFMHWPGYRPGLWQALLADARKRETVPLHLPTGTDRAEESVAIARENALRAGVGELVQFACCGLEERSPVPGPGLVLCNPPYGVRLECRADLHGLYRQLGTNLQRAFPGWTLALIVPEPQLVEATGLPLRLLARFANGGLPVGLYARFATD